MATMNWRTIQHILRSTHIALVVILPAAFAFLSLTRLHFRAELEGLQTNRMPVLMAVQAAAGQEPGQLDDLVSEIRRAPGVAVAALEPLAPEWTGDPQFEDEWNSLWNANAGAIVFVTGELAADPFEAAAGLAETIGAMSGVEATEWNQDSFRESQDELDDIQSKHVHMTFMLLAFMLLAAAGLVFSHPLRFRRRYAVQTGAGGAGALINPETVWLTIMGVHAGASAIVFTFLFLLGYTLFPFSLALDGSPGVLILYIQGLAGSALLTAAVISIGWWMPADEIDEVSALRPPAAWGMEE